jgi:hypothetical protein
LVALARPFDNGVLARNLRVGQHQIVVQGAPDLQPLTQREALALQRAGFDAQHPGERFKPGGLTSQLSRG